MTLPTLLAELDSAPSGCLDDVRRQLRVIVVAVMEMREAKAADPLAVDSEIVKLRQLCTSLREERDLLSARLIDARAAYRRQYDDGERTLAECVRLGVDVNTLRADVARLTAERDENAKTRDEIVESYRVLRRERDALAADAARLAKQLHTGTPAADRMWCPHYGDCNTCKDVVANTKAEFGALEVERDAAIADRERTRGLLSKTLDELLSKTLDERYAYSRAASNARATVAAEIAAWFERHPEPGQLTRERIAEDIREGRWRKEGM